MGAIVTNQIIWPKVPCCSPATTCTCDSPERVMRWVAKRNVMLTPEQRTWCIDQLSELMDVEGYKDLDDLELAEEYVSFVENLKR